MTGLPGGGDPPPMVALDFAVTNALGQGHWDETLKGPLEAAKAYSRRKNRHARTEAACAEAGIIFEPIVLETQGGVEPRAAAILHRIAALAAGAEGLEVERAKADLLQRLAIIIARAGARAIQRRTVPAPQTTSARTLKRTFGEIANLEAPSGHFL